MFSSQKNPFTDGKDGAFDFHRDLFIINEMLQTWNLGLEIIWIELKTLIY